VSFPSSYTTNLGKLDGELAQQCAQAEAYQQQARSLASQLSALHEGHSLDIQKLEQSLQAAQQQVQVLTQKWKDEKLKAPPKHKVC
jgi:hypothetical protein